MGNKEWFRGKNGMMMHWGLYSLLGGEYRGKRSLSYAEWIQSCHAIPNSEYSKLAQALNPLYFNADELVQLAKDCGMEYFVVTSKHHDGFALFHSKVSAFNSWDATPFHRDIIEELASACARKNVKLGLYYSQDLDWHEPDGGGYLSNHMRCSGVSWDNSWDYPDESQKDYSRCFESKIMPQIEEILSNYGDICLTWFDVPMTINEVQSRLIYDTVKRLQPDCLINSRLGNNAYDYVSLGDNEIPDRLPEESEFTSANSIDGFKPSPWNLYETAATLNDSWGYCAWDRNWKQPETLRGYREKLNALGINYLLNIGPDGLGRVPADGLEVLKKAFSK